MSKWKTFLTKTLIQKFECLQACAMTMLLMAFKQMLHPSIKNVLPNFRPGLTTFFWTCIPL